MRNIAIAQLMKAGRRMLFVGRRDSESAGMLQRKFDGVLQRKWLSRRSEGYQQKQKQRPPNVQPIQESSFHDLHLVMTRRFYGQLQAGAMMSMSRREADNARAANEVNLRVMIAEPSNKKKARIIQSGPFLIKPYISKTSTIWRLRLPSLSWNGLSPVSYTHLTRGLPSCCKQKTGDEPRSAGRYPEFIAH